MEEGIYTVREVKDADKDGKELVLLEGGMRGFTADTGKFEEGDEVEVEQYEDYRGETSFRAAGKVE